MSNNEATEFYISKDIRKKYLARLEEYIPHEYAKKTELGIYHYAKQYCESQGECTVLAKSIYKLKANDIIFNIKDDNPTMANRIESIKNGKYNAYNLAYLRPEELNPDPWEEIINRRDKTEYTLNHLSTVTWKKCRDCKTDQYKHWKEQTRSADEPMTSFYQCKECGRTYRVNN